MLITGTQTGGIARIKASHLCLVERYDYERNCVESRGTIEPSSETMTHTWSSGLYGGDTRASGVGWFGDADDNSLFDYE